MPTSNRLVFLRSLTRNGINSRTAVYGPVRTVVWQGSVGDRRPYADPLFNIQTGEVIFGGVGAGLYGILLYAILAVFIAGLMVGRTPEYIGKKIEGKEVKMAMLALICRSE